MLQTGHSGLGSLLIVTSEGQHLTRSATNYRRYNWHTSLLNQGLQSFFRISRGRLKLYRVISHRGEFKDKF